jgi:flavin-dependent dehydrogenase
MALGHLGVSSVMFEAGGRFRDKSCGDGLVSKAVETLRAFGLSDDDLRRLNGRPFDEVELRLSDSTRGSVRVPHVGGWVIPRARLDQALRDAVSGSCDVRYGTVVRCIATDSAGVLIETSQPSRRVAYFDALIVAAGSNSKIAASFGLDGRPMRAVSFRAYIPGSELPDVPIIEFTESRPIGYTWRFPIAEGANVGACRIGEPSLQALRRALASELDKVRSEGARPSVSGGVGLLWSGLATRWHHMAGIVSCGDSAGVVDPLTGEGISAALVSGRLAGEAIGQYMLNGRDPRALEEYSRRVRAYFAERYSPNPFRLLFETFALAGDTKNRR